MQINVDKFKELDETNLGFINLIVTDETSDNKHLSQVLEIPLSTIQRRVRKLFDKKLLVPKTEVNYSLLDF